MHTDLMLTSSHSGLHTRFGLGWGGPPDAMGGDYFYESASHEPEQRTSNSGAATKKRLTSRRMMSLSTRFSEDQPRMPRESRERGYSA